MIYVLAFIILGLPLVILYPTKIIHKERLKRKKKCIATSNHYSMVEPMLYDLLFARKFRFMAKKELFENKFFGFILKSIGAFPVDRNNVGPSVFKKVLSELKSDHQVFIFPEGTRNTEDTEEMLQVKTGVITFASKGDAEIVPMLIYHRPRVFRKNYIIVGEPFKVKGANPQRLTKEEVQQNLEVYTKKLKDLRKELNDYVESKKRKKKKNLSK